MADPLQPLLAVEDLRAGYGSGDILQGIGLRIEPGEMVATIGRNGVGKSTLMKAIMGMLPAMSGAVSFRGEDIARLRPDQRAARGIGYVPQGREVFPSLTVEENLAMGETINRDKSHPRYDLVYGYFPILAERRRQLAGTFSGGQQQMLAIARALVGRPELLLLDEPSMGIQPSIIQEIGRALVRLNEEEKVTILLVEQNTRLIAQVARRAYAIDKGRIVGTLDRRRLSDPAALAEYLAV
ncbi:ABC transporter ATP-binding protein [Anaeromyxobacter oryzae]|uniref:ABC transporter ATP-binding protein n=1 Tax=Anaeromyxobacter oryzae TaxID=2918170 RepID=A0ABM7WSN4_9BACT|nr:ABC transporter ATP-binding protein [Anaeromyxobacter oryzae]BDG02491.1 ABC transporter ATP-binding protein [Anaeromyxobacter oryzae]